MGGGVKGKQRGRLREGGKQDVGSEGRDNWCKIRIGGRVKACGLFVAKRWLTEEANSLTRRRKTASIHDL